jgi:hypothetical protein
MARAKKNRELNLLTALDRSRQRRETSKGKIAIIAFVAVIAASTMLFYMHLYNNEGLLIERRDTALSYVDDPGIRTQYDEALSGIQEATAAKDRAVALLSAVEAIDSYPDISADDLKKLFDIAGKKVDLSEIAYDRSTGELTFFARCSSVARVPAFIETLRSCGIFSDVNYSGYTGETYISSQDTEETSDEPPTSATSTEYSFNVICIVNADEYRAEAQTEIEAAVQTEVETETDAETDAAEGTETDAGDAE